MRLPKICVAILGIALIGGAAKAATKGFGSWIRLETDEFAILSDASPKDVEEFAVQYAAFRGVVHDKIVGPNVKLPRSLMVLFRKDKTFKQHVPESKNSKFELTVFTTEVDGTALTALCVAGDQSAAIASLFEFEMVWMLRRANLWVPIWMSQGTGEVLSSLRISKGRCLFGDDVDRLSTTLRSTSLMKWPRFFSISNYSPEYNGEIDPGLYHAQAWALMRWVLLADTNGQERFTKLAALLKSGMPAAAVREVMNVPEEKFNKMTQSAMLVKPVWLPFDEKPVRAAWRVEPAGEAEVRAQLTDLLAAAGKPEAAANELAQARVLAPNSVQVLEARARQALRSNDKEEAASLYREAITAGSKNPQAFLFSARVRLDGSSVGGSSDYPGGGGFNVGVALDEIRQALAVAPGSLEAYEALGRAFFVAPKITLDDVAELSRGIGPGRIRVLHYRALLYERLNKHEESLADLRAVVADPECPPQLRKASQQRVASEMFAALRPKVEALVKDKKFGEARTMLSVSRQENPDASENYDRIEKWVADNEQIAVFAGIKRQVDDLVEEKKFTEAKAVLDAAVVSAKGSILAKDLGRLRAWLEETTELDAMNQLFQTKQWGAFHERVQAFFQRYPKSLQNYALRQADERAQKMQAASTAEPAAVNRKP